MWQFFSISVGNIWAAKETLCYPGQRQKNSYQKTQAFEIYRFLFGFNFLNKKLPLKAIFLAHLCSCMMGSVHLSGCSFMLAGKLKCWGNLRSKHDILKKKIKGPWSVTYTSKHGKRQQLSGKTQFPAFDLDLWPMTFDLLEVMGDLHAKNKDLMSIGVV